MAILLLGHLVALTLPSKSKEYCLTQNFFSMLREIRSVFNICILPELVGKWYSRKKVFPDEVNSAVTIDGEYIYCYCKVDKGGKMIGCDNRNCMHGRWFHLECLRMISVPRSNRWYCPDCRTMPEFSRKRKRDK